MKNFLLAFWHIIDPIYYFFTRLQYVQDARNKKTIFRVRLTRYKGAPVTLKDGTVIRKYDLLLKIHLHNERILSELHQIDSELKRAVFIYHQIKHALPSLAHYVQMHHKQDKIKGIIGITSLHRGAGRLGFDVIPVQNPLYRLFKKVTFVFIHLLSNHTGENLPSYLMLSKDALLDQYIWKRISNVHERLDNK